MTTEESLSTIKEKWQLDRTQSDIFADLARLCQEPGFIYSICLMVGRSLWMSTDEVVDIDWNERPNQGELSLLLGLLARHTIKLEVVLSEEGVLDQVRRAMGLLEELHQQVMFPQPPNEPTPTLTGQERLSGLQKSYEEWMNSGLGMVEPIFYGREGAYDFQFLEMASTRYAADDQWIQNHTGYSPETFIEISKNIGQLTLEGMRSIKPGLPFDELSAEILSAMSFRMEDFPPTDRHPLQNFITAFSFTPGGINQKFGGIWDYNEVHSRPVMSLGDGRHCSPILPDLPKAIYESPFYWMNEDDQYRDTALSNRGNATESITQALLVSVFGSNRVFRGVKVKRGRSEVTDIDVLAISGNKAVIAQCKSKKLTIGARQGDGKILRRDFIKTVQDAYGQAIKGKKALTESGYELIGENGVPIPMPVEVDEVFILCVSGDHYPAVMTQARVYLNRDEDDSSPILLSIFDLDVVSFYLHDRYEFLYYLRQRSTHAERFLATSEMALLGFHLSHKLFPDKDYDGTLVDEGYVALVDANFLATRGNWPKSQASERLFHQWKNDTFGELVEDIKLAANIDQGQITPENLLFFLYDLAGKGADQLTSLVRTLKEQTVRDGKRHEGRLTLADHKKGTTFISFPVPTRYSQLQEFEDLLEAIALVHKYMSQADEWMALASIAGTQVSFDIFEFFKEPWQRDPQMDQMVEEFMVPGIPLNSDGTRPGKNRRCPCGSGRKFKRCHGRQDPSL